MRLENGVLSEGSIGVLAGRGKCCLFMFTQLGRTIVASGVIVVATRDFVICQPCLPCSTKSQSDSAAVSTDLQ